MSLLKITVRAALLGACAVSLSGCLALGVAGAAVGTTVGVAGAVVGGAAKGVGAVAGAVVPGGKK